MRLIDLANHAHEDVSRALASLPECIAVLASEASPLRGTSYDTSGGTQAFCWTHGQGVRQCEFDGHSGCVGEVIEAHDPTGEAAIEGSKSRADMAQLWKSFRAIELEAKRIIAIEARTQRVVVVSDRAGIGRCENTACNRYVDGVKDRLRPVDSLRLCSACRMRQLRAQERTG